MNHRKTWLATLLWNTPLFILVYLFLGETKLFHPEPQTSKSSLSFVKLPRLFDVQVALCVVLKGGMFMAQPDHKHSRSPGLLWICVQLTQGQRRRKSSSACVLTQRSFVFPLSTLCILHWEQTNIPALVNIVTGTPVSFLPFPPLHGDRGWYFKRSVVVILIFRREL